MKSKEGKEASAEAGKGYRTEAVQDGALDGSSKLHSRQLEMRVGRSEKQLP